MRHLTADPAIDPAVLTGPIATAARVAVLHRPHLDVIVACPVGHVFDDTTWGPDEPVKGSVTIKIPDEPLTSGSYYGVTSGWLVFGASRAAGTARATRDEIGDYEVRWDPATTEDAIKCTAFEKRAGRRVVVAKAICPGPAPVPAWAITYLAMSGFGSYAVFEADGGFTFLAPDVPGEVRLVLNPGAVRAEEYNGPVTPVPLPSGSASGPLLIEAPREACAAMELVAIPRGVPPN